MAYSFTFFMTMNIAGFVFHSTLPITSRFRTLSAMIDQASTGLSGGFLALEMYSLFHSADPFPFGIRRYLGLVWFTFTFSLIPVLAEWIYVAGCLAVFLVSLQILVIEWMNGDRQKHHFATKMAEFCFS